MTQADIVARLRLVLRPECRVVASLNGVKLRKAGREWNRLKAQGAYEGFPDLQILAPEKILRERILLLEVKRRGNTLEESQEDWQDWCTENGYLYYVVYSALEAIIRCQEHGLLRVGVRPQ